MIPITRTDGDIGRTIRNVVQEYSNENNDQNSPNSNSSHQQIHNILEMFIVSQLPVHILRGVEPNLRHGGAIKQYFNENINRNGGEKRIIPQCPFANSANAEDSQKCIHLASRKQIGDAIIRYEDQSII